MQELNALKQNRYHLQQLIEQEHHGGGINHNRVATDLGSVTISNPSINLKKRFRNDSSDLVMGGAPQSLTGHNNHL